MSVPFCVIEFENAARGDARAARSRRRHRPRLRVLQQVMRMGSTAARPPATLARATQRPLDDRLARRPCAPSTRRRLRSLPRRFRLGGAVRLEHMGFGCQEAGRFRFTVPTRHRVALGQRLQGPEDRPQPQENRRSSCGTEGVRLFSTAAVLNSPQSHVTLYHRDTSAVTRTFTRVGMGG